VAGCHCFRSLLLHKEVAYCFTWLLLLDVIDHCRWLSPSQVVALADDRSMILL